MAIDVLGLVLSANARTTITGDVDIALDAAMTVGHGVHNTVSTEVREDGLDVSDNVVTHAEEVTIEGFVSDYPVEILGGSIGGAVSRLSGNVLGTEQPSETMWQRLKKAAQDHLLLDVVTRLGSYEDMLIVDLETTQTRERAHSLQFTMTLRRMRTATAEESAILDFLEDVLPGSADRAAPLADRGQQTATVAP